ncbi:MAG TPA: hypothetical protein VHU81_08795, partial [Thermoanaerobaculia bacterium]|nr:hypothetical protein [Thermoanaerobaculia bacterium]
MNEAKRRFFSGDSLQQALVQAANYFNLAPEQIAYRSIEKRHGFLKVRRKVVIEVNPDAPRREKPAPVPPVPPPVRPAAPVLPTITVTPATEDEDEPMPSAEPAREPQGRDDRGNRGPQGDRGDRGPRDDRGPRRDHRDNYRGPGGGGDRGGRGRSGPGRDDRRPPRRDPRREEGLASRPAPMALSETERQGGGLVTLPERPLRPSERFPEATGPQADAARKATELLLSVAGLELEPRVLQGEERLEIDLSGEDVDWCFADDGEFLMAVEHLLPRMIRSLSGEPVPVRVDCDNFHDIREERLRSLAQ